ncbi:MAG: NAD(P)/FAD-dependent oxidoreductase [Spirochaetales bacterium]|nr:NAD(P)/FAD-dependent oxidoreductase [Spirochaetales bacterium]
MKRIVILGGGYAGVHAAKILLKAFKKDGDVSLTLIDKNFYHTLMTELHEVAGDRVDERCVKISFNRIFSGKKIDIIHDEIVRVDRKKKELHSHSETYSYDYLIMGIGAEPTDFGIPGVLDNSLTLWSYSDAIRIKRHVKKMFYEASTTHDREKRKKMLTFIVAGAGFTGIEMIGELIEWLPLLADEFGISKDEYSLINVEALGHILNMIPEKPRAKAMKYMEKRGVQFRLHSFISQVDEDVLHLKDGENIEFGTLIWTCGVRGSKQAIQWGFPEAHVQRITVDETMLVSGSDNVYAVGDIHWLLEDERPVPQIVEAAEQTAAVAAKNIINRIKGEDKKVSFKSNFHGFMVSIGGRYAVSYTAGFALSGIPAMAMKHLVNCYYLNGLNGFNGWSKYIIHEIFRIKNGRSLLGGFISGNIQGLWAVPLRMWLGVMWLFEAINKIGEGWLNVAKGTSSSWMFSQGVIQNGMPGYGQQVAEAVSAASEEVVEQAADVVSAASEEVVGAAAEAVRNWGPVWDLTKPVLSWDSGLVTWFRHTFMDGIASHIYYNVFQAMVVTVEGLIGLALLGGLFTFPAAGVSIIMCFVFILSGLFSWSQVWFIFAGFLLLGGSGRTLGLDYWVQPWLKRWWNGTKLAKKTYLYFGEPRFKGRK